MGRVSVQQQLGGGLSVEQAWGEWDAMVSAARRVLGSADEAGECATQAIVQVLERRPQGVRSPQAYMVTIAKRRAVDRLREQSRARVRESRLRACAELDMGDVAEGICDQHEARWVQQQARKLLPLQVYRLLELVADGMTVRDAARELSMTARAAESHLLRARKLMRSALAKTLAVLAGCLAGLRRFSTPALTVTVAALITSLLLHAPHIESAAPLTPDRSGPALRLVPDAETRPSLTGRDLRPSSPALAAVPTTEREAAAGNSTPLLTTPVVLVKTSDRDDGHQSTDPVDRMMHCLQTLSLLPPHQGCQ